MLQPNPGQESEEWSSGIRRWSRYAIDVRLKVTCYDGSLRTIAYGRGTNISEGGIAAYISMELRVGKKIHLEMNLPYCVQTIHVAAVVRDRRDFCYGLEFDALTPSDKEIILRTCRALSLIQ